MRKIDIHYGTLILLIIIVYSMSHIIQGLDFSWKYLLLIPLAAIVYVILKNPKIGDRLEQPFRGRSRLFFLLLYVIIHCEDQ